MPIRYEGMDFQYGYRADLFVEHKLIVAMKRVEAKYCIHFARVLTCLELRNFKLGLFINLNVLRMKHGIRRVVNGL